MPRRIPAVLAAVALAAPAAAQLNELISKVDPSLISETAGAGSGTTSASGRFVAFTSEARNLVYGQVDANDTSDVFLFDRVTGVRTLVSHRPGAPEATGNGRSEAPLISDDGAYVVFTSTATDLVGGIDTNAGSDVFLFERATGTVTLVSHALGAPTTAANGGSWIADLDSGAAFVAYQSLATDLVAAADTNGDHDVFLFERSTATNVLVSHAFGVPGSAGNGASQEASLSGDGRFACYLTRATDIVSPFTGPGIVLYDRLSSTSSLVTHVPGSATTASMGDHEHAVMSASGDVVVFDSTATDLVSGMVSLKRNVFAYERQTGAVSLVSHVPGSLLIGGDGDSDLPRPSGDGRYVAFTSLATDLVGGTDTNGDRDVFLSDRSTATTVLASHASSGPAVAGQFRSERPSVSADGRFVSFDSLAMDLVAGTTDIPGTTDVFYFDRLTGAVALATHRFGDPTATADSGSGGDGVSAGGGAILFFSVASDLTADVDSNADGDLFLFDRAAGASVLVSRRDPFLPGLAANRYSDIHVGRETASADGRFVAFRSSATNLLPGFATTQGLPFIDGSLFLRDRLTGAVALVSHVPGSPTTAADRGATGYEVSDDGRFVVFTSPARNLVEPPGSFGSPNVYLFDSQDGSVTLVSHVAGQPTTQAFGDKAVMSGDGNYVAFFSVSTALVPGTYPVLDNVFLYERTTGAMSLVSHAVGAPTTGAGNYQAVTPQISGDGRYVAFETGSTNLVAGSDTNGELDVFLYDRLTTSNTLVSHAAGSPSTASDGQSDQQVLSADGSYVAFRSYSTDIVAGASAGGSSIYLYDVASGTSLLASHTPASPTTKPNGPCDTPSLSAAGGVVVFASEATDLVPGTDTPGSRDAFAFERASGSVRLVSHALAGQNVAANSLVLLATVSGSGTHACFASLATDLVAGTDGNLDYDVFLWERASGDVNLVSHAFSDPGVAGHGGSFVCHVTGAGNFVVHASGANDLFPGDYNATGDVFAFGPLAGTADVSVTKTDGVANVDPGSVLTYTITVQNAGPAPVLGASLVDTFVPEISGVSWTCAGLAGAGCGAPAGSGSLVLPLSLPAGASVVVTATGTLAPYALGQVYNTATVGLPSGIVDPVLSNNSATDVDTVTPAADMSVTQDDDPDPLFMGQALAYTMTVRNSGPATATAVTLTATLPPGAPFVSSTPGPPTCTQATGVLTCDLGPIDVLASSEVTAVVQAAAPGPLSNVAVVSAAELDLFPVNNTWTETSLVVDRRPREIGHRSGQVEDLSPATSPIPGADLFRMLQRARSSYEVVVDAVTGDLGPSGPGLDRVQEDGSTVVQSSTAAGAGGSRVLAWQTASPGPVDEEYIRVTSNGCSPCEAEDTYRIRAWETTAVVPRFNNSGTQVTLLLIQNTTDRLVTGTVWLQAPDGSVAATLSLSLPARQILVVNTASVSPSGSGSIRISHDGGLGALQGKAVAVEPATGFTFDTRLQYRP